MLTATIFINGVLFGIVLAVPAGPVGVLCVHRTLAQGPLHGLLSGLGAAVGDALYGVVAAFGISAVADWIDAHQITLRTIGGAIMLGLAVRALVARPQPTARAMRVRIDTESLPKDFVSTFALAITNPVTLLAFATLLATLGLAEAGETFGNAAALVVGVFLGSLAWWLAVAFSAGFFRPFVEGGYRRTVNYVSAAILAAFGVYALTSAAVRAGWV